MMKIAMGSDHGGFELKERIKEVLASQNYEVVDCGTDSTASVDYVDFAEKVTEKVVQGECERGIVICGTGLGISIAANKVPGIRAALVGDSFSAKMSREHNNANVLALGARVTGPDLAVEIVKIWLETAFEGGRHERRVNQITEIEKKHSK